MAGIATAFVPLVCNQLPDCDRYQGPFGTFKAWGSHRSVLKYDIVWEKMTTTSMETWAFSSNCKIPPATVTVFKGSEIDSQFWQWQDFDMLNIPYHKSWKRKEAHGRTLKSFGDQALERWNGQKTISWSVSKSLGRFRWGSKWGCGHGRKGELKSVFFILNVSVSRSKNAFSDLHRKLLTAS